MLIPRQYILQRNRRLYFPLIIFGGIFLLVVAWFIWLSNLGKLREMNLTICFEMVSINKQESVSIQWLNQIISKKIYVSLFGFLYVSILFEIIFFTEILLTVIIFIFIRIFFIWTILTYFLFLDNLYHLYHLCNQLEYHYIPEDSLHYNYSLDFLHCLFLHVDNLHAHYFCENLLFLYNRFTPKEYLLTQLCVRLIGNSSEY